MTRGKCFAVAVMATSVVALGARPARATNDLSLNVDPGSVNVQPGDTVTVTLDIANLSAAINGVQIRINYDTTIMTLIDVAPTDLVAAGLITVGVGWVEINQTDTPGDIDWAAVINDGSIFDPPHTIATLTFTVIDETAPDPDTRVIFRLDSPPFRTKLTRASDSSTISPNTVDSGPIVSSCDDGNPCTVDTVVVGLCNFTPAAGGTLCRASADECDPQETCDGASTTCPLDTFDPNGSPCTDDGFLCTDDVCQTGVCSHPVLAAGTVCRAAAGECDVPETCPGTAACPADGFVAAGIQCTDATPGDCDDAQCDGLGACNQLATVEAFGFICRADNLGGCDVAETCDGFVGGACPADAGVGAGFVCRAAVGECDLAESCDATSAPCPADGFVAAGIQCTDATPGDCDDAQCNGLGACDQLAAVEAFGFICRADNLGGCDEAETCDGFVGGACPADAVQPFGFVCRAAVGECDPAETCDGASTACPADLFLANGAACTDDGQACTNDFCQSGLCIHPVQPSGIVCRASAGSCDPAETCDGSSTTCPADVLEPVGTLCRAAAGLCDLAETCDGGSVNCPADAREPFGTVCRASIDECDPQEECDGVAALCPSDSFKPDGAACTDDGLLCSDDVCQTGVCSHPAKPALTVCRALTDECDPQEVCDGTALTCPGDSFTPDGVACTDEGNACTSDECLTGVCTHTDTTPVGQCCDPLTGTLTAIDDADPCTNDVCNADGTVSHDPAGEVTANLKVEALIPPSPPVTRDVKFIITVCGGTVDTRVVPVSFDGFGQATVVLGGVDANASWVSVAEGHTLRRLEALSIVSCSGAVDFAAPRLPTGDLQTATVAQDNLVDIVDFSILASRFNDPINANLSIGADVTGDGQQNIADFTAMQDNFFVVGEGVDGCPATVVHGGLQPLEGQAVPIVRMRTVPRSSIAVEELGFPGAHWADMNGDGMVDGKDIRLFARLHGLELLPEFSRKLEKLEGDKVRARRGR